MHPKMIAARNSGKKLVAHIEGISHPGIKEHLARAKGHIEKDNYRLAGDEFSKASEAVDSVDLKIALLKMAARASAAEYGFRNCEMASKFMDDAAMLKLETIGGREDGDSGIREMMVAQKLLRRSKYTGLKEFLEGMGGYGSF